MENHPFTSYWVECKSCGARGPRVQGNEVGIEGRESGKQNAIKAWNTRVVEDKLVKMVKDMLVLFDRGLPEKSLGREVCDEAKELLKEIDNG
jgi:hypothetical protein